MSTEAVVKRALRAQDIQHLRKANSTTRAWRADRNLALSARQRGWTEAEIVALYLLPEHALGAATALNDPQGVGAYVRRKVAEAERFLAANPPIADHRDAAKALADSIIGAVARRWPGKAGPNELAVLLAITVRGLCLQWPSVSVIVGYADLAADIAVTDTSTVHKTLVRLQRQGLIARKAPGGRGWATTWQIRRPVASATRRVDPSPFLSGLGHDVFTTGGLGRGAWLTWSHLGTEPKSVTAISALCGQSTKTVRANLKLLADVQLATNRGRTWCAGTGSLDQAARALSVFGVADRIAEQHRHRSRLYSTQVHGVESFDRATGEIAAPSRE